MRYRAAYKDSRGQFRTQTLEGTYLTAHIPYDVGHGRAAYNPENRMFRDGHRLPEFSLYAARVRAGYWRDLQRGYGAIGDPERQYLGVLQDIK